MQALLSIQAQQNQLSQQRHLKSEQATEKGFIALAQAEADAYRHKHFLREACDHFAEGIAQNRLNPDPHLGMAIVLFLLKEYPLVRNYLEEVRRLAPEHPDLQSLELAMSEIEGSEVLPFTLEDLGNYDELETRIHVYFREISTKQNDPTALILEPVERAEMQSLYQYQHENLNQFQLALVELEKDHDTSALHKLLTPLQQLFKRTEKQLKTSETAYKLYSTLQEIETRLKSIQAEIEKAETLPELKTEERNLEHEVDLCDQIADRLDELGQAGYRIEVLETLYEQLVNQVEHCFELIDGKH